MLLYLLLILSYIYAKIKTGFKTKLVGGVAISMRAY